MSTTEDTARRIFGQRASMYTTSTAHTDPQVLARVVELSDPRPDWSVLDIATGTGHTAFALAPHVRSIIGTDLTPEMLAEAERLRAARSISNVTFRVADVHRLPFENEAFQLITCRRAAHHFSDIRGALAEMRRVLRPGGRLVIDDRSVPDDDFLDACMNELDRLHDESHVREYRPGEWRALLTEGGFDVEVVEPYRKHRPLTALTAGVSPDNVRKIHAILDGLDAQQRAAFNFSPVNGEPHLNHWFVVIAARKR
jgi:ubiquinone/menaquinone biosynthesis C-methylase UbiE